MSSLEAVSVGAEGLGNESDKRRVRAVGRNGMPCPHTIDALTKALMCTPVFPGLRRNSIYPTVAGSSSDSSAPGPLLTISELFSSENGRIPPLYIPKGASSSSSRARVPGSISVPTRGQPCRWHPCRMIRRRP
jgi:hypothetical protein